MARCFWLILLPLSSSILLEKEPHHNWPFHRCPLKLPCKWPWLFWSGGNWHSQVTGRMSAGSGEGCAAGSVEGRCLRLECRLCISLQLDCVREGTLYHCCLCFKTKTLKALKSHISLTGWSFQCNLKHFMMATGELMHLSVDLFISCCTLITVSTPINVPPLPFSAILIFYCHPATWLLTGSRHRRHSWSQLRSNAFIQTAGLLLSPHRSPLRMHYLSEQVSWHRELVIFRRS